MSYLWTMKTVQNFEDFFSCIYAMDQVIVLADTRSPQSVAMCDKGGF